MAFRSILGCLPAAAFVLCALTACKDKGDAGKGAGSPLEQRCEQLGKACGDQDKHVQKIIEECKVAAKQHVDKGCADKATALYDCYEKDLCGKADKVWTFDDLRVLSERHNNCVAERTALRTCAGTAAK